jgi:hypothetical protein
MVSPAWRRKFSTEWSLTSGGWASTFQPAV